MRKLGEGVEEGKRRKEDLLETPRSQWAEQTSYLPELSNSRALTSSIQMVSQKCEEEKK